MRVELRRYLFFVKSKRLAVFMEGVRNEFQKLIKEV